MQKLSNRDQDEIREHISDIIKALDQIKYSLNELTKFTYDDDDYDDDYDDNDDYDDD